MTLGEKLQKLRKEKNLSQEQLAEALAVSRQAVSKWELADAMPDTDKIVLLANYFDVSTDYLLQENAARATQVPTSENMQTHTESGIKWLCITIICMTALNALLLVLFHRMQVAQFILPVSITAISVLLYFVFTHMRTSGDYTMLAGFHKDAVYEMESFKKMVESIAFYILLSNFWYAFMLHILLWCTPPKIINPILIVVYVLETTGVIVLLNFKYGNRIYKEKTREIEREVKKGTTLVLVYVLLYMFVSIVMIVCFEAYGIRNNTPEALKMVGIVLADVALVTGCLFYEVYSESETNRTNKTIAKRAKIALWLAVICTLVFACVLWFAAAHL